MHLGPLLFSDWEATSSYQRWVTMVVTRCPELRKCFLVIGPLETRGVALSISGQEIFVHLEDTVCEHCEIQVSACAVPDFGVGEPEYRDMILKQPPVACPNCGKSLNRRHVLRYFRDVAGQPLDSSSSQ